MLTIVEIFIVLVLNPILTALLCYFLLGNKLLKAFKNFLRAKNAQLARDAPKGSNTGGLIGNIIGMIPPEVIGKVVTGFLTPKEKPPIGGMTPKP